MKRSTKITSIIVIFFLVIAGVIIARTMIGNHFKKKFTIIDARSRERFNGSVPDPRKNVRSGSIPNSVCLPFKEIINSSDNTFKGVSEISKKFSEIIDLNDDKRVFSCGSGITACVLGLAYSLVNNTYSPTVYDGSWAEYGRI